MEEPATAADLFDEGGTCHWYEDLFDVSVAAADLAAEKSIWWGGTNYWYRETNLMKEEPTTTHFLKEEPTTDHFIERWRRNLPQAGPFLLKFLWRMKGHWLIHFFEVSLKDEGGTCCCWSIWWRRNLSLIIDFVATADLAAEKSIWWRRNLLLIQKNRLALSGSAKHQEIFSKWMSCISVSALAGHQEMVSPIPE